MNQVFRAQEFLPVKHDGQCENCKQRQGSINWVGEGGALAYSHGMSSWWCEFCATEAQLAHAKKVAADIPDLERRLNELRDAR